MVVSLNLPFIIIFSLIFAGLLWLAVRNFKLALYLFIFLVPVITEPLSLYIKPSIPLITFARVMLVILTLGWLIRYSFGIDRKIQMPPLFGLIILFTGLLFLSTLFSTNQPASMKEFFSERKLGVPFLYFLVFQTIKSEKEVKEVLSLFIAGMALVSLLGIAEFIIGKNIFYAISALPDEKLLGLGFGYLRKRAGFFRIQSSQFHPIALAAYLVFILSIALLLFKSLYKRTYYRLIIAIVISIIALGMTFSAGAWLVFILILGAIILRHATLRFSTCKKRLLIIGVIIITLSAAILYQTGIIVPKSVNWRLRLIEPVIKTTLSHPLFGTGFSTYNDFVKFYDNDFKIWVSDPMSYFQLMLVENGIPALLVFIIICFLVLSHLNRAANNFLQSGNVGLSEPRTVSRERDPDVSGLVHGEQGNGLFWAFIGTFILALGSVSVLNCSTGAIIFWISVALSMRLWLISKSAKSA